MELFLAIGLATWLAILIVVLAVCRAAAAGDAAERSRQLRAL